MRQWRLGPQRGDGPNLQLPREAQLARRLYDLTVDNIARLKALADAFGIDCKLERRGALTVMRSADDLRAAQPEFAALTRSGVPLQMWCRQRRAALGTDAYVAAICDPNAGQVHPGKLVRLWKTAAEAAGARIYEESPVVRIEAGRTHRIVTGAGHVVQAENGACHQRLHVEAWLPAPGGRAHCQLRRDHPATRCRAASGGGLGLADSIQRQPARGLLRGCTPDGRIHFGGGPVDYQFNNGLEPPADAVGRSRQLHRELRARFHRSPTCRLRRPGTVSLTSR